MNDTETIITEPPGGHRALTRVWLARRWPTGIGILLAASIAGMLWIGIAVGDEIAPIVTASGFVYLGAAAFQRRIAAWPMFLIGFVLITIGFVIPGFNPSWWMIVLIAVVVMYGLVRGAMRPPWGVPLQAAAFVVLAVAALIAVALSAPWGGLLVSAGLLAHAAWDLYHHRVDRVVVRSIAEFCGVLDTLLALVVLGATLSQW